MPDLSNPTTRAVSPIIPKLTEVRDSLVCLNQELMLIGHTAGIEGTTYRLSQIINLNVATLSQIIEDSRPHNDVEICPNNFSIFENLLPIELEEYKKIEAEKHKVFSTFRLLEGRKWEILKSVRDRLQNL